MSKNPTRPNNLTALLASNRPQARRSPAISAQGGETTIYLYDAIVADDITAEWWGGVSAQTVVPQIRAIKGGTAYIRVNSPGGDVFAAQAICQAMRDSPAHIVVIIDGYAASAATVIASAADEVKAAEGAMYMIHCGWTMAVGNAEEMRNTAGLLDKVDTTICAQYAKKTGKSEADIMAMMRAETWFTAAEALEAGFIDAIADSPKVKAEWDLSAYQNAPAPQPEEINNSAADEHRERQRQRVRMLACTPIS